MIRSAHCRQVQKKPAYVLAEVEITDPPAFPACLAKVPETIKPYNSRLIALGKPVPKDGPAPQGTLAIVALNSLEDAESGTAHRPTRR
ncbi:MAG: DUF1330 domain-containing protein [Acetobacteraceae bacterium]|nr:DUF1330 domain-containing protein [Acetobacteraceae bacterium]